MMCTESNQQRISFASDLGQSDKATPVEQQQPSPSGPVRRDTTLLDSNSDFEFHISRNFDPGDSSPADEIFADGMILPVLPFHVTAASAMPKRLYKYELPPIVSSSASSLSSTSFPPPPTLPLPCPQHSRRYSEKETSGIGNNNGRGSGANSDSEAEKSSKSFWSFTRSSSLNCDIKKSLICSFPRLTRSNSTGSVANSKRAMLRDINKHSSQRNGVPRPGANPSSHLSSSSSSSLCFCSYQFRPQKHAGKNGSVGGGGGGNFRIAPVTGSPSPFGLGSILRFSKEKKTKNK